MSGRMKTPPRLIETHRYAPAILSGGHDKYQPGPQVYARRAWYALWALRAGQWEIARGAERRLLRAPSVLLIEPESDLTLTLHGNTDRLFIKFIVTRGPRHLHNVPRQPPPDAVWGVSMPPVIPPELTLPCLRLVAFCCDHWWRGPLHRARADARLADWLAMYALYRAKPGLRLPGNWLERCRQLARERLHSCLNVRQWAQAVGLSRQYFTERFTAEAGQSPRAFLAACRVEQACAALRDTEKTTLRIARENGFRSERTFARFMLRHTGLAPRPWRQAHRLPD